MNNNYPEDTSNLKLIVCDYDGTLVGREHIVSESVVKAVHKWQDSGRLFTLATARSYFMMKDVCQLLRITLPIVTRGGAEIVDPTTGDIMMKNHMKKDSLEKFLQIAKENNLTVLVEHENFIYTNSTNIRRFPYVEYRDIDEFVPSDAPKMVVYVDESRVEETEVIMNDATSQFPDLHIVKSYRSEKKDWDITAAGATKNSAVLELFKILKIERENTVGVGDGYNDFPLLEATGFKVAMGNADEALKGIADIIVPTFTDEGVAVLINRLLNNSRNDRV